MSKSSSQWAFKTPQDVMKRRLMKKLGGLSEAVPPNIYGIDMAWVRPDREDFPVPELVLFALRDVLGCKWQGVGEKVRWTVYCTFLGIPYAFELRKFGFTICYATGGEQHLKRLTGQLQAAIRVLEELIQPDAQQQLTDGNVTIVNRYAEFHNRYLFFREQADQAFKLSERPSRARRKKGTKGDNVAEHFSGIFSDINRSIELKRQGFYNSTAMVDAYFSCIEHQLVLLFAFLPSHRASCDFRSFIFMKWDDKLKVLFDIENDKTLKPLYAELKQAKERIRNPFAHGGMENDGGSLFFYLPKVGVLPANLTQVKKSVHFNFLPIDELGHGAVCKLFDDLDAFFAQGGSRLGQKMINAGINPAYDRESLKEYALVSQSDTALDAYIAKWSREWERHANMDY